MHLAVGPLHNQELGLRKLRLVVGGTDLVGKIALLSNLTFRASERVVLRQNGNGSGEFLEEIVLTLSHFLHKRLSPFVMGQLVIHQQEPLVVQDVPVVVVVQNHGGTTVISHILYGLWVRNGVRALLQHVRHMLWVQR
ncbi:hypothetical protein Ahy_B01g055921 [Arachis hypogaea]|uniref:Uncharacterized protein n=1 Tax=Arachis hypogaea TaxID=3818 RepID=A0A445AXK5_ARAHY|nr:hypothetical protein Ahy_B01g055921 [Arachis hypogaea]